MQFSCSQELHWAKSISILFCLTLTKIWECWGGRCFCNGTKWTWSSLWNMQYTRDQKKSSIRLLAMQVFTKGSDWRWILYNALVGLVISMQTHYMSSSLGSPLWRIQSRSFSWQKDWFVHWPMPCVLVREVWKFDLFKLTTEQVLKNIQKSEYAPPVSEHSIPILWNCICWTII